MRFWYAAIRVTDCTNYELKDNVILENSSLMAKSSVAVIIANCSNGNILGNYFGITPDGVAYINVGVGLLLTENSSNNTIGGTATGQGNIIANNYTGIQINTGEGNKISGNRIFNNPLGIILSDGGNLNKATPVITSYDSTTVNGTSEPNDTIEVFSSTGDENANEYLTTVTADGNGDWTANISDTYQSIIATAIMNNNTSAMSENFSKDCSVNWCFDPCKNRVQFFIETACDDNLHFYFYDQTTGTVLFSNFVAVPGNSSGYLYPQIPPYSHQICVYATTNTYNYNPPYSPYDQVGCYIANFTPPLVVNSITATNTKLCLGESATINVDAINATDYFWYNGSTSNSSIVVTPTTTTTYTVTVTNGCVDVPLSIIINVRNPEIVVNASPPHCADNCDGTISVSANLGYPPYTYHWAPTNYLGTDLTNLCSGTYSVTVVDVEGCTDTETTNLVVNLNPDIELTINNDETCVDACDGSVTASVTGWASNWLTNWSWVDENGQIQTSINNPSNPFNNLCPNTYTYNVTNPDNNCASSQSIAIEEGIIGIQITDVTITESCLGQNNGSINVNVSLENGFLSCPSYSWSNDMSGNYIVGLAAGSYTVTICCHSCCIIETFIVPSVNVSITATPTDISDPCVIGNGAINLIINPPDNPIDPIYLYQWSQNANNSTSPNLSNLCPGFYGVTVTDIESGCTFTQYASVGFQSNVTLNPLSQVLIPSQYTFSNGNYYLIDDVNITGGTYDITGNIYITSGHLLSIDNSTLRFMPGTGIFVNPTCTLSVSNSSVLTSFCNVLWRGINAIYNNDVNHLSIVLVTNSTIENALQGIYASGFVKVNTTSSFYYNNRQGVSLRTTPSECHQTIQNNWFETNLQQLFPSQTCSSNQNNLYPDFHVILDRVSVINTMTDNDFLNSYPYAGVPLSTRGNGVKIVNGTNAKIENSHFEGLWYGVMNYSIANISNSNFTSNNRGVYSTGNGSHLEVYDNVFEVSNKGNQYNSLTFPYGVCVQGTNSYKIFKNIFKNGFIGTVNRNTGIGSTPIWKNTFENLYVGSLGNGSSDVRFNCNTYTNNCNLTYYNSALQNIAGGDIMAVGQSSLNSPFNTFQTYINNSNFSTLNSVENWRCGLTISGTLLNYISFHNRTPMTYEYWFSNANDDSDISDCDQMAPNGGVVVDREDGSINSYDYDFSMNCPDIIPIIKSLNRSLIYTDSLYDAKEYKENVLNVLTDGGQTQYFLNYIQNLKPNNFNILYNQLIAVSPYISDEVLIAFMTNPINKPAHKKDVILANSPLPYKVRQYINQMNVNQNFKNQIWVAQNGKPNARVQLENEINWLSGRRQTEITMLALDCVTNSLDNGTDSLIDYLGNYNVLEDRKTRYGLLVNKKNFLEAKSELSIISGLTYDLPLDKQVQYEEFKTVLEMYLNTLINDSITDSPILENETFLQDVASTEFHPAQTDAKILLEMAGISQEYEVSLLDDFELRTIRTENDEISKDFECDIFCVLPNPSDGNMTLKYELPELNAVYEIILFSQDGKVIQQWSVKDISGEIKISCSKCNSGNYILSLYKNRQEVYNKHIQIMK